VGQIYEAVDAATVQIQALWNESLTPQRRS